MVHWSNARRLLLAGGRLAGPRARLRKVGPSVMEKGKLASGKEGKFEGSHTPVGQRPLRIYGPLPSLASNRYILPMVLTIQRFVVHSLILKKTYIEIDGPNVFAGGGGKGEGRT